jgi:hypothetical protein
MCCCGEGLVHRQSEDADGKKASAELACKASSAVKTSDGKDVELSSIVNGSRPAVVVFLR